MPNVIYTATLDFTDNGVFNAGWRIKQGDFGSSSLNITLTDNGVIFFDDSIEPEIVFKRADGRSVISTMQSAGENSNYYMYNFVGNELAVPGPCVVDVKIVGSDSRTSTASCRFDVIEDTIGYDPTGAGTYNNPVALLIDIASTKSGEAEAWAVGTKNGSPVSSGDPTYHNNSKYWSELRMGSKIKNTTGQFYTTTGGMLDSCVIGFEPIQDLHGYSKPWTGGGGKNKLPLTVRGIKSANSGATWSGNSCTLNGVTWTINTDSDGNVISIKANGTASANSNLQIIAPNTTFDATGMTLNGCPSGGGTNYYIRIQKSDNTYISDTGSGVVVNSTIKAFGLAIANGTTANNLVFKPMLRLSSVSDATFEPYSNICPISGHTQVQVGNVGKNLLKVTASSKTLNGLTFTVNDDGSIKVSGTASANTYFYPFGGIIPSYLVGKSVIVNGSASGVNIRLWHYDGTNSVQSVNGNDSPTATISTTDGAVDAVIWNGTTVNTTIYPMLRLATEADATFEPYKGYTTTINLGGTYYGGTLDAVSGVLTVEKAKLDLGSLNWTYDSPNTRFVSDQVSNMRSATMTTIDLLACSCFAISDAPVTSASIDNTICTYSNNRIYVKCSQYTGATAFKNAMSGQDFSYPLATPITIQLTPTQLETLVGQNNLSAPLEGQSFASAEYRDNMSAVYITDERVVGKWIDGKDICQRTIDLGSSGVSVPANSSASTGLAKGNVELPIWSTAISPSGQAFPHIGCSVGSTYIMMENKAGNATTIRYFTFQYTKS